MFGVHGSTARAASESKTTGHELRVVSLGELCRSFVSIRSIGMRIYVYSSVKRLNILLAVADLEGWLCFSVSDREIGVVAGRIQLLVALYEELRARPLLPIPKDFV